MEWYTFKLVCTATKKGMINNRRMKIDKVKFVLVLAMSLVDVALFAQTSKDFSYEQAFLSAPMRWNCQAVETYLGVIDSLIDKTADYKECAVKLKDKFGLYNSTSRPGEKLIATQAFLQIQNPVYNYEDLLNYINTWAQKKKEWQNNLRIDKTDKSISGLAKINVANHGGWVSVYKIYTSPSLVIQVLGKDRLLVSFLAANFKMNEVGGNGSTLSTSDVKIADVFPVVQKSSYKNSYAKAYIGTYQYFWKFIGELRDDLNKNFTRDAKLLSELRYEHVSDSLRMIYGEPTNVISHLSATPDVYGEIRFYEKAQKVVFMGKTINFKDVMNCVIDDDPKFIPGHSYTYGAGLSFFGIGIGGAQTTTTPDQTIHNYVVKVKMDNLKVPFIYIAVGQDKHKAIEIQSSFEYIMRHQQNASKTKSNSHARAKNKRR